MRGDLRTGIHTAISNPRSPVGAVVVSCLALLVVGCARVSRLMARMAPGGRVRPFTAALPSGPPRGRRACRMWGRRRIGDLAIAATAEGVAG
jgi:hypothetical protein